MKTTYAPLSKYKAIISYELCTLLNSILIDDQRLFYAKLQRKQDTDFLSLCFNS